MKIAVLGAGLLGLSTAYHLCRHGISVTVIDRANGVGLGASHANGAILTSSMSDPWNAPGTWRTTLLQMGKDDAPLLLRPQALAGLIGWGALFLRNSTRERFLNGFARNAALARYSLACLDELEREAKLRIHLKRKGSIKLCRNAVSLDTTERVAASGAELGITYSRLDRDAVLDLEPSLLPIAKEITGAIFHEADGSGDAFLFCVELERACREAGVDFHFGEPASLRHHKGSIELIRAGERIDCDAIVVAAGIGSASMLKAVGVALPLAAVKGYSITVPAGHWTARPARSIIDNDLHIAATPVGGAVRVAGIAEFAGTNASLSPARVESLKRLFTTTFPQYPGELRNEELKAWTGFRPVSPDGVPMIGATQFPNLFVNIGHGHLGWTQAAGSGRLLADHVVGLTPAIDLAQYAPNRFRGA